MSEFFVKILGAAFNKITIPLSVLIFVWLLFSPSYNNVIELTTKVDAHEKRFDKLDVIDQKLNEIMLKLGIQEYRINRIERGHPAEKSK